MLRLKEVLAALGVAQAEAARVLGMSSGTFADLLNHGHRPKRVALAELECRIADYLHGLGADPASIATAFEEVEPPRANAEAPTTPENETENEECEPMLMLRPPLLPDTREAFGLHRNPFDNLKCAEDMYVSPDIRYIREAMYQAARFDDFLAVVGESGAGKSTLCRDLIHRLETEGAPVIVIQPHVLAMEDNDRKGKTLKATHIAEAIMAKVAPLARMKSSPEARFAQLEAALKSSHAAGYNHVLIIEEAHSLPQPTLKHLKRFRELYAGFTPLLSIILIGQPELAVKLSPRNGDVREVTQRISIAELRPMPVGAVEGHLAFRLGRAGKRLDEVIDAGGIQAVIDRLSTSGKDKSSQLYPQAIGNLVLAAMNLATRVGESRVTAEVVGEV